MLTNITKDHLQTGTSLSASEEIQTDVCRICVVAGENLMQDSYRGYKLEGDMKHPQLQSRNLQSLFAGFTESKEKNTKVNSHTQNPTGMGFRTLQKPFVKYLTSALLLLLTVITSFGQLPTVDLKLSKTIDNSQPQAGDLVKFIMTLENEGTTAATSIVVEDMFPIAGLNYGSGVATAGSWVFNGTTGIGTWSVPSLQAGGTVTLEITATVTNSAMGVFFNVAEIKSVNEEDYDSVPNNKNLNEDDIATACFSVPIMWRVGDEYNVSIPPMYAGVTNTQWMRNGTPINANTTQAAVNTDGSLSITGPGTYTFTADVASCGATGCCAIQIVDASTFDLALRKTTLATSVTAGQDVTFDLTVFNQGNINATNIRVVDYIPTGFTLNDSNWEIVGGIARLKNPITSILAGGQTTVSITLRVNANAVGGTRLDNFAEISDAKGPNGESVIDIDSTPDDIFNNDGVAKNDEINENGKQGGDEDDHDIGSVTVVNRPIFDVALAKRTNQKTVLSGQTVTFNIEVINQGTEALTDIVVVDYVPVGLELVDPNWTLVNGFAYDTIPGPLAASSSIFRTINLKVKENTPVGIIRNVAEVSEAKDTGGNLIVDEDSNLDNTPDNDGSSKDNVVSENRKQNPSADEDDHDIEDITVIVDNIICNTITSVTVNNPNLCVGESAMVTATSSNGVGINWYLSAIGGTPEFTTQSGVAIMVEPTTTTTYYVELASLTDPKCPNVRVPLVIRLNARPLTPTCVEAVDICLDEKVNLNDYIINAITTPGGTFEWRTGPLSNSPLVANPTSVGPGKYYLFEKSGQGCYGNPSLLTVKGKACDRLIDLSLRKTADKRIVSVNDIVTYTIEIKNESPLSETIATNVEVEDVLPSGLTFVSSDDFVNNGGTLKAMIPSIGLNETVVLRYRALVTATGTIINYAQITAADQKDADSTPDNGPLINEDDDDDEVITSIGTDPEIDLSLQKIVSNTKPKLNDNITYTIRVRNDGPDQATNVEVTDVMPSSLQYVSAAGGNAISQSGGTVKAVFNTINVGQTVQFTVVAKVIATGTSTNTAEVTKADQSDTDSTPNNGIESEDDFGKVTIIVENEVCTVTTPLIACANPYICLGESTSISAIGCNGTIVWSNGQVGSLITVSPTTTTTYTAQCRVGDCLSSSSNPVTVVVNSVAPPVLTATTTTICQGSSTILIASGCSGSILWSNGMVGGSIQVSPLVTTSYTAICKVANCESAASQPITITVGNTTVAPTIAATSATICVGQSVTLTAIGCGGTVVWSTGATGNTLTLSPSVTTSYTATCQVGVCVSPVSVPTTITVSPRETPVITSSKEATCGGESVTLTATNCTGVVTWSTGATGSSIVVSPTTTTTYTATCGTGVCAGTATKTITVGSGGTSPIITSSDNLICVGESVTLTATGCTGGVITWNTGVTGSTLTVSPLVTTTYTATCTTGTSCVGSSTSTIAVTPRPNPPVVTCGEERICAGEELVFTGHNCDGIVTWSTGATGKTMIVNPVVTTVYTATCTVNGCVSLPSVPVTIEVITQTPTITSSKETICSGESVTLTAGNCSGTYTWSTGSNAVSITVSPSVTTTYSVKCLVEDCEASATKVITVNGTGSVPVITSSKETICTGESVTLTATNCTGVVTWSTGATGSSIVVSPTTTTTYTATCGTGVCVGTATKTITVRFGEIPTITASKSSTCGDEAVVLTASTCSGVVTWSTGATGNSITVTPSSTTTYTATCTVGSCVGSSQSTIVVTKPTPPVVSSPTTTLCAAGQVTLTATGCAGTVTWSNGQQGNSITVLVSSTTTYAAACKVGDCSSGKSNDLTIVVNGGETPTISASKETVCGTEQVVLTAGNCSGTLTWSTGATTSSITVTPTVTTKYTVTCTVGTCSGMAEKTITVSPTQTPIITASKAATCGNEQVTLTVAGCSDVISWSIGVTTTSVTVSPTATTTYTVTCGTGICAASASSTVIVTSADVPVISASTTQLCEPANVSLTATGCTNGTIVWSTGQVGTAITVNVVATTTYSATCQIGTCTSAASTPITITVGKPTPPVISSTGSTVCSGSSVTLTAVGCTGNVIWSNGLTGNVITVSPVTKTIYTAVCQLGTNVCTSNNSNEVTVNVISQPNAPVISCSAARICAGDEITLAALGCDGQVTWSTGATGKTITATPIITTTYTAVCKIGDCSSPASAATTINVGKPFPPQIVCEVLEICSGGSTTLEAKGCVGEVVWSTGQVGNIITVSPTTMTSYSAICDAGRCESDESNVLTVSVSGSVLKPTVKDLVNVCPNTTVDLTTAVTSSPSVGGAFIFRTGNSLTSPLVADPSKATTGTYYVFESTGSCVSQAAAINVAIINCNVSTDCVANPAIASAGKDSTICLAGDFFTVSGNIGGSAQTSTWTTSGTGTFENSLSPSTKYFYSLADVNAGSVTLTITTNDPDGTGSCVAATSSMKLTINAVTTKPTIEVSKSPNICFGDSVTLTAKETGNFTYLWNTGATTQAIKVKASGSYSVKLLNANGCASVSSDAVAVNVRSSIPAPTVTSVASNVCPATSVNLALAVTSTPTSTGGSFEFRTGALVTSPMLANVSAVPAGDYYVFERSDLNCVSTPSLVKVLIDDCSTSGAGNADIAVDIAGTGADINIGDQITYTLTVENKGPAVATNVNVSNTRSTGLEFVSGAVGMVGTANIFSVTIPTVAVGEVKTYTYVAKATQPGKLSNEIQVTGLDQVDAITSNNYDKHETECVTCQETCVAMALSADTTMQANGSYQVLFTALVENCGNTALTAVDATHNLGSMFTRAGAATQPSVAIVSPVSVSVGSELVPNVNFDGKTDLALLNKLSSKLGVGKTDTIRYTVLVTPNGNVGPFSSNANVNAQGLTLLNVLQDVSDVSNNGKSVVKIDATPTTVKFFASPSIGLALAITDTLRLADDCYNVTFKAVVKNNGSLDLTNVVIKDDLAASFTSPATFSLVGVPTVNSSSQLIIDSSYNGTNNTNLTTAASTLVIGKTDTVTFVVKVCPATIKRFENQASAQGTGTLANNTTETPVDLSNNGMNPDAPGQTPTELILGDGEGNSVQVPCIGVALFADNIELQADSSYNITYKALIRNCGNLNLTNVSLCDTLSNTFGLPAVANIVGRVKVSTGSLLVPDSTFDGKLRLCLLDSTQSSIAPNKEDTVTWTVNVVPNGFFGPFRNNVTATAKSPSNQTVSDISNDGLNSLPDGNTPTIVNLDDLNTPVIGVAKDVKSITKTDSASNVFDIVFEFTLKNYGLKNLSNVQLQDNLAAVFGDSVSIDSVRITADAGLTVNSAYTGKGDLINLLVDSTSSLPRNATRKVELFTRIDLLNSSTTVFNNVALGIGRADSVTVDDQSTAGTNPDTDADGDPKDNSEPTVVDVGNIVVPAPFTPIGIAKAATVDTTKNADGSYQVQFTVVVQNFGTRQLTKVQLSDSLMSVFADSTEFVVVGTPKLSAGSGLMIDSTFNGNENVNFLIADSSSLAVGAKDTLSFVVKVLNKNFGQMSYSNSIAGSALDSTTVVTDISQSGLIPDANNDGNPGNDSQPTVFQVGGSGDTDSTIAVIIPEAISPNGDNLNDKFVISNIRESDNVSVAIYNRWGHLVFLSDNYKRDFPGENDGWNGVANQGIAVDNSGVPAGTYFYCIISENSRLFGGKPFYNFITVAR